VDATLPEAKKYVLVGAPHTSNWDFIFGLSTLYYLRLKVSWMAKDSLFRWPLGYIMRGLGGMPVKRDRAHGVVEQMVENLDKSSELIVGLAAKGTRKKTEYWKSGFYWIAYKAKVPIVFCGLDYKNKTIHINFTILPTGNVKKDMDKIRMYYSGIVGKHPKFTDNVRLKEENDNL